MLVQRRRRWANIKTALGRRFVTVKTDYKPLLLCSRKKIIVRFAKYFKYFSRDFIIYQCEL